MTTKHRYCGVEGGGSSFRVAIAEGHPTNIVDMAHFPTLEDPSETLGMVKEWLQTRSFDAIGIGCFGPLDLNPSSETYGYITTTLKKGWKYTNVLGAIMEGIKVPYKFDTDVNAPALAEYKWNNSKGTKSCAYITVGTGVGVGLVINGATVHGLVHPEAGQLSMEQVFDLETYKGTFGSAKSVEGVAGCEALATRRKISMLDLPNLSDDDPAWDEVSNALGWLIHTLILVMSPERIIVSGGMMNRECILPKIRNVVQGMLRDCIQHPYITTDKISEYIVSSIWGQKAGIIGSLTLAYAALEEVEKKQKEDALVKANFQQSVKKVSFAVGICIAVPLVSYLIIYGRKLMWRRPM